MKRIAIFPGSFDPVHVGHIDIINKASELFDFLYVVVSFNNEKNTSSSFTQRKSEIEEKIKHLENVKVLINKTMMTAFLATELHAKYLIRSARNDIDFQYELELAAGSNHLNKKLETILIIPTYRNIKYQSRLIKQKKGVI